MRRVAWILGLLLAAWTLSGSTASLLAITVLVRGESKPIYGTLVRQTDKTLVVQIRTADGSFVERTLARDQIELLYHPVDPARLESLDPAEPERYRDYAEELADKKKDPEARQLSLRLYWLAAVLAPERLGKSCLLGMTSLAETEAEASRYRAVAYLLDASRDKSILERSVTARSVPLPEPATVAQRAAYRALEALRRGDYSMAIQIAQREGVQHVLEETGGPLSYQELLDEARRRLPQSNPPDDTLVVKILLTEKRLWTRTQQGKELSGFRAWFLLPPSSWNYVVKPLQLKELLPFDPDAVYYRQGRWLRPEELLRVDAVRR